MIARWSAASFVTMALPVRVKSAAVSCWPGRISATATLPRNVAGSVIAPAFSWSRGSSAVLNRPCAPAVSAEAPCSMTCCATSTEVGTPASLTLLRYCCRKNTISSPAIAAATTAAPIAPFLDDSRPPPSCLPFPPPRLEGLGGLIVVCIAVLSNG